MLEDDSSLDEDYDVDAIMLADLAKNEQPVGENNVLYSSKPSKGGIYRSYTWASIHGLTYAPIETLVRFCVRYLLLKFLLGIYRSLCCSNVVTVVGRVLMQL